MNSRDFCYWLQGFVNMANPETLSGEQMDVVKRQLAKALASETKLSFPAQETTLAIFSQQTEDDLPAGIDDPAALASA
ncbi:MAG: hypothetical protein IAI49_08035, partial [Candidatus Eremiobacteraeota bacterium]|nr:hypothetical protein [Candidatus Eremiobacteraeota bacterium]